MIFDFFLQVIIEVKTLGENYGNSPFPQVRKDGSPEFNASPPNKKRKATRWRLGLLVVRGDRKSGGPGLSL